MRATETELAKEMGVSMTTLFRFLSGRTKQPKKPFLLALGVALDNLQVKIQRDLTSTSSQNPSRKLRN